MAESETKTPAGPVTIQLRKPIQIGKADPITELTFRPFKAKDLRGLPDADLDIVLALAGRLSGQPNVVIDELGGEDWAEVAKVVSGFLPSSPETGSVPSP